MAATDIVPEEVTTSARGGTPVLALGGTALFLTILLFAGGIRWFGNASDGEPMVVLTLPDSPQATATVQAPSPTPASLPQPAKENAAPRRIAQPVYAGTALVADPALIENTAAGPLPRIADDGRTPMQAYAPAIATGGKPGIAIVVTGLGIGAKATSAALQQLPPAMTLAFVPVAANAQQWVNEARRRGHEVLLQVPMEPYDYPDSDPGPNTMRVGERQDENMERLSWAATRITGYAGLMNLAGSRLMADADSLAPVLTFAARRGLMFFESGTGTLSAAVQVASQTRTPFVKSSTAIDAVPDAADIDRQLSDLETNARANGIAAAAASAYPVTLARLKAWAQGLPSRGFVLVPASAIVAPAK